MTSPPAPGGLRHLPVVVMAALLVPLAIVRVRLASSINVNWDELYFLSHVHSHLRGALSEKLLTFHVHFLAWVARVSSNEIDQVLALREVMLAFGAVAVVSTVVIGWRLIGSAAGALFAVFAGQSLSLVLNHGASARFDPIIVALFLAAAALLSGHSAPRRRARAVVAGVVVAVAMLVSIKSALYLPTLVGLLVCRVISEDNRRDAVVDVFVFLACLVVVGAALFGVHVASLAVAPAVAAGTVDGGLGGLLASVFKTALVDQEFPQPSALMSTLRWDGAVWLLALVGFGLACAGVGARRAQLQHMQLLCFILPLVGIAVYRNSFAYFYVSVVPPAALLAGLVVGRVHTRLLHRPVLATLLILLIATPVARAAWRWNWLNSEDQVSSQRDVVDAVHAIFPTPVPYVDRCAMIATFPKAGPFMSTWTLAAYRKLGTPIMEPLLRQYQPQFVLQNVGGLELGRSFEGNAKAHRLLPADFAILQQNFIPHWGPIWVAGKAVSLPGNDASVAVDVVIAGRYVLESAAPVMVDGAAVAPSAVVELVEGAHTLSASRPLVATLRTASAQPPPTSAAPKDPLFVGFGFRTAPKRPQ
ncbi:MAG: hypothetical protein Q8O67_23895 [Deltaproteobacteria bacterium]|nr:hypothetical protein [Deltaproteobacteria bacterium]